MTGAPAAEQLAGFLRAILLGGCLGLVYDLFRAVRRVVLIRTGRRRGLRRAGRFGSGVLDAAYGLTAVLSVFLLVMAGDGELQVFTVLGVLSGAALFFSLLSGLLRPLWDFWLGILLIPVWILWRLLKKAWHFFKKLFSFLKTWFTIISTKLFSGRKPEDERQMRTVAKAKKKGKRRPSSRLTGLLLVVLMIGIGVQLVNLKGELEAAREEEAYYSQRLQQLQAENARLEEDIANSDDPELIEAIAREELGMVSSGEKIFIIGN